MKYTCARKGEQVGVIYLCMNGEWHGHYLCENCMSAVDYEGRDLINDAIVKSTKVPKLKRYRKKKAKSLSTEDDVADEDEMI